jgi:flagellar export protein FliJ
MKPFHFKLEALGTLRRRQEQKALELYAQTLSVHRQTLEALAGAERQLRTYEREWRNRLAAGCAAVEMAQAQTYYLSLTKRREECAMAVETAERRMNAALQGLSVARQQREIVDKFFDKQKARHQRDQARAEQKFQDELARRRGNSMLAWKTAETPL